MLTWRAEIRHGQKCSTLFGIYTWKTKTATLSLAVMVEIKTPATVARRSETAQRLSWSYTSQSSHLMMSAYTDVSQFTEKELNTTRSTCPSQVGHMSPSPIDRYCYYLFWFEVKKNFNMLICSCSWREWG